MCFFILKKNLWRWWRWRKKSHFDQQRSRLTPADTNLTRIRQFCNYNSKWVMGKRNEMFDRIFLLLDNSKKLGWSILCERSWKKRKKGAVDKLKYFDPNKFKFFVTGKTFSSVKLWTFDCRYQSCDFLFFYCKKKILLIEAHQNRTFSTWSSIPTRINSKVRRRSSDNNFTLYLGEWGQVRGQTVKLFLFRLFSL